jgi:hypothetical protein
MDGHGGLKVTTLIFVNYNGLTRPSEIKIQSIGLWVRLYNPPPTMMKPTMAELLG